MEGNVEVGGHSYGNIKVGGHSTMGGNVEVGGHSTIEGNIKVGGHSTVRGHSTIEMAYPILSWYHISPVPGCDGVHYRGPHSSSLQPLPDRASSGHSSINS